ncbi:MAG: hypothetical protein ACKVZJ_10310 [Phycisphaerales bacterium]
MSNDLPIINMRSQFERWNDLLTGKVRAALLTYGDSNNNYSSDGWNDGMARAAFTAIASGGQGLGCFATALLGYGGAGNTGVGSIGGDIQATAETEALTNLPSQLDGFKPSATQMVFLQPWWRETNVTAGNGRGYQLNASNALGNARALRARYWFGTGPSWGGTVQLAIRQDSSPFTQHVTASRVLTGAGGIAYGLREETLDLNAGVAADGELLLVCQFRPGQAQTAPIYCPFMMAEAVDQAAGLMVSPMVFAASQHLGTIEATYRTGCGQAWKIAHMQAVNARLGTNGFLVHWVNSGINDHTASRSAAQFVADFEALRGEVLRISDLAGISRERHLFMVGATHPQNSAGPDATLRGYINALTAYAPGVPNVLVVNLHSTRMGSAAEWTARHDGGGAAHLKNTTAGYTDAALAVWRHIRAAVAANVTGSRARRALGAGVV